MTTEYTVNRLYPKPDFDTRTWHEQSHDALDMIDADMSGVLLATPGANETVLVEFNSRAGAEVTNIPASVQTIQTAGRLTPGDGGDDIYYKVGGSTPNGFQSADGAWWAIKGASRTRFWSDVDNGAAITTPRVFLHRERMLVGDAVNYSNLNQMGGSNTFGWLSAAMGPSYLARDGVIVAVNDALNGGHGLVGAAQAAASPGAQYAIGVAGYGLNGPSASAWGGYFEAVRKTVSGALGVEVDVRNAAGAVAAGNPYGTGTGPHGLWVACGPGGNAGTNGYGPTPNANSGSAMVVLCNKEGSNTFRYTTGIIIAATSLAGVNGTDGEAGANATALGMARGHAIRWYASNGAEKLSLSASFNTTDVDWNIYGLGSSIHFARNGAAEGVLTLFGVASAVNYFILQNAATGGSPQLVAVGTDTDVDVVLRPQGAGTVRSASALRLLAGTAIPAGGTAGIGAMLSSTANFGVFFGSGAPTLSAAKGSLYLRSDGTTTNDRMYVNTNGSTTWTAVNTVA